MSGQGCEGVVANNCSPQVHNGPPHSSNFGYAYAKRLIDVQNWYATLCACVRGVTFFNGFCPTYVHIAGHTMISMDASSQV